MAASVKRPEAYPPPPGAGAAAKYEGLDAAAAAMAFDDVEGANRAHEFLRRGFARKVFGLLACQLLLTAAVAAPIVLSPDVRGFVERNAWLPGLAALGSLALILVLSLSESARHSHPTNLILLAAFTAMEGVLVGTVAMAYSLPSVALAVAITAGVCGGLAAYAQRTKADYTAKGGLLVSLLLSLILAGCVSAFTRSGAFDALVAFGGAALFGAYIVFDVQMIMGGAHRQFQLSPDDYIPGAIALYLDCINMFIYMLRLFGSERE